MVKCKMNWRYVVVVGIMALIINGAYAADPVEFADVNLKNAVENQLGVVNPTHEDMIELVTLIADGKNISSLQGIEYADNLRTLHAGQNTISDISPLADLTKLRVLELFSNALDDDDMHNLTLMTQMEHLALANNSISDISVLANMPFLRVLNLCNNNISDISVLAPIIHLTFLELFRNHLDDADMYNLTLMTQMEHLSLANNSISDISVLANMPLLRILNLANNNISDISDLSQLTKLRRLILSSNPLDCPAYNTYIPMVRENNPGTEIFHDPIPAECSNEPPVAVVDEGQRVAVGDTVWLDGSDSWDPDSDPLTYAWSFFSTPDGSTAAIEDTTADQTSFIPNLPGDYVVDLVVNDGTVDSELSTLTVVAISAEQEAQEKLEEIREVIWLIAPEDLRNANAVKPLTNKINAILAMIDDTLFDEALVKLQDDILSKTDGCAEIGEPDGNDWLLNCDDQDVVYPMVMRVVELLQRLVN